jgi:hypothetical protein
MDKEKAEELKLMFDLDQLKAACQAAISEMGPEAVTEFVRDCGSGNIPDDGQAKQIAGCFAIIGIFSSLGIDI